MSTTPALQHLFISSKSFAVLGASADRSKYGNKVLLWYQSHGLDVVPIHPVCSQWFQRQDRQLIQDLEGR